MYDDRPTEVQVLIISRGSAFAITMVYGLTQLVAALGGAAELSGHTRRVAALLRGLQQVEHTTAEWRRREAGARRRPSGDARTGGGKGGGDGGGDSGSGGGAALLECRRLVVSLPPLHAAVSSGTFQQPERAALLRGIALRVGPGRSLLLRGAAGAGKSALLRVVCGLWPMGEGQWPVATGAPREIGSPWPPHRRTAGRGDIERRNNEDQSPSSELSLACVPPLWDGDARRAGAPTYLMLPQAAPLRPGVSSSQLEQLVTLRPLTPP